MTGDEKSIVLRTWQPEGSTTIHGIYDIVPLAMLCTCFIWWELVSPGLIELVTLYVVVELDSSIPEYVLNVVKYGSPSLLTHPNNTAIIRKNNTMLRTTIYVYFLTERFMTNIRTDSIEHWWYNQIYLYKIKVFCIEIQPASNFTRLRPFPGILNRM